MAESLKEFLTSMFDGTYDDEINRRNGRMLKYLSLYGMAVCGVGVVTRLMLRAGNMALHFSAMFALFVLLGLLHKRLIAAFHGNTTRALYVAEIPFWILSIMVGSIWDPHNRAVTFLLFLLTLPLFILDRPSRVMCYTGVWVGVFCTSAFAVKTQSLFLKDLSFVAMFTIATLTATAVLLAERLNAVRLLVDTERHARQDELTGLMTRYALACDIPSYLWRDLLVAIARVDDLSFFVDSMGHDMGDEIERILGQAMAEAFGYGHTYRYTAHELLVILKDTDQARFEANAQKCRGLFMELTADGYRVQPQLSLGYVFGVATDEEDLRNMIRHADIRLAEAARAGQAQIRGAAYDRDYRPTEGIDRILGGNLQSGFTDPLTGLPNRQAFYMRARYLIGVTEPEHGRVMLIYFDLENFKRYNEEHGYQKGDDLLRGISVILRETFPRRIIARLADDHFVVMCYEDEYEDGIAQTLNRVFDLHAQTGMPLKAGVYAYTDLSEDVGLACDRAKAACDSVKQRYDVFWRLYDDELRTAEERRVHIISRIDDAIANEWLRVYYQPIINASTGAVVECEALVRWIDPTYGFLPPMAFIGELEHAHLIHKVDLWMIEHVCADYHARVEAGLPPLPVSVNLSRLDFVLCDVEEELQRITSAYDVPVCDLHVEVTESALSEDFTQLVIITNRLRELGFEIWLDDFGSDYSSLTTLKDFPCDVVKLDLMFLRSFASNERSRVIIQQVVELARRLGARSLAEGVEEPEHLEFLAEVGCDLAQGYLISKPEPLKTLIEAGLVPA